jgi:hypothetical protein
MEACREAKTAVIGPMMPFVEAVDKFQLLSVIDDEFVETVRETYETTEGELSKGEFDKQFSELRRQEVETATGQQLNSLDNPYVNPVYFYALNDIVNSNWKSEEHSDTSGTTTQGRVIAEAVARATLDVPQPIEPLGDPEFSSFSQLTAPELDVEHLSAEQLRDRQYTMTKQDFDQYLGRHPTEEDIDRILEEEKDILKNGLSDLDFEYTYQQARQSWVARAFVNARKGLDTLREDTEVDLTEIDSQNLRRRLVGLVHGVDINESQTMIDHPTALLEIPQKTESGRKTDVTDTSGSPLPKVLIEAFEEYASFGGVVYYLNKEERRFLLNWNAREESISAQEYNHVPEGIESYEQLWHYYYYWKEVRQYLRSYREQVTEALVSQYNSYEEVREDKKSIERQIAAQKEREDSDSLNKNSIQDLEAASEKEPIRLDISDSLSKSAEKKKERKIREEMESASTLAIRELAKENNIGDIMSEKFTCPFCKISGHVNCINNCQHDITAQIRPQISPIARMLAGP